MSWARRMMFLVALMFWQGGMMFYGGVTVPVMRKQLSAKEDEPKRSQITQRVTQWLNLAGTAALVAMAADVFAPTVPLRGARRWLWLAAVGMQVALVIQHRHLSQMMAEPGFYESDLRVFSRWHSLYLIISTVQWAAMMGLLGVSTAAWRMADGRDGSSTTPITP